MKPPSKRPSSRLLDNFQGRPLNPTTMFAAVESFVDEELKETREMARNASRRLSGHILGVQTLNRHWKARHSHLLESLQQVERLYVTQFEKVKILQSVVADHLTDYETALRLTRWTLFISFLLHLAIVTYLIVRSV